MEFNDPSRVLSVIDSLMVADSNRAANRAQIDDVFNGVPPYSQSEADEGKIDTNVNFLQGTRITADARGKLFTAMLAEEYPFTITLREGEPEMKTLWGSYITESICRTIRENLVYIEEQRNKHSSMILHGWGPMVWDHPDRWCPFFSSMEDTKFPGRTLCSLRNLEYFAVYRRYTPSQLQKKLDSKNAGWDKELAMQLIERAVKDVTKSIAFDDYMYRPELLSEDIKANSGFYESDAVATINTWEFYYKGDDEKIWLLVLPWDSNYASSVPLTKVGDQRRFLFRQTKPFAECFDEVLALTVTDGNAVAPNRLDTCRSLGFLLFALVHLDNRMRSKQFDSIFENLLTYFSGNTSDEESVPAFQLKNYGMIPSKYKMVPQSERHNINESLVYGGLGQLRQMMSEFSASFTEDFKTTANANETATAIMAKVNAAAQLLNGMLSMAYVFQVKEDREVCRRFCKQGTTDPDCKAFQEEMEEKGVPKELIDVTKWNIRRNKPIGVGNKTIEMVKTDKLMASRGAFDEEAQRMILLKFALANTDDPALAAELVPKDKKFEGSAQQWASISMGSLMQGLPVLVPSTIARGQYAFALLTLANVIVHRIEQNGSMATEEQVVGLATVVKEVYSQIQVIAQDPQKKQVVKILGDQVGQLQNKVKAYAQRLQEQGDQGGVDPAVAAAVEKARIEAISKAEINAMSSKAKENRKDEAFVREANRREAKARQDMAIQAMDAQAKIAMADAETAAKINRE